MASSITLKMIQDKLLEVATDVEASKWADAIRKATAALAMIAARPDREFDDHRIEWRNAADQLELLLKTAKKLKAEAATSDACGLVAIPVRRSKDRS